MKTLKVVAAIIKDKDKIFATKRGHGEFKNGWEFPGGKIEPGERPEEALHREIMEELNIEINIEGLFDIVEYDYPNFHLTLYCFISSIKSGKIVLLEHEEGKWLGKDKLDSVAWLPADISLIKRLKDEL